MIDKNTLKNKYERFITFDEPIPYWSHNISIKDRNENNCLLFYPIMIRDMFDWYRYCGCLLTDHTSQLDRNLPIEQAMKVLSMSCYEYLFWKTFYDSSSQDFYIYAFSLMLSICLRDSRFKDIIDLDNVENKKLFLDIFDRRDNNGKPAFLIDNVLYDSEDFDNLKEILAYQNELELPDIEKDKRFRDARDKAKKQRDRILSEGRDSKMGGLEDQLICLSLGYGLSYDDVGKVSLRKFNKMISYMNKKINYEIYLQASMSGFVEFKDKSVLKHWMTALDEDKYSDVLMDADTNSISNNINTGSRPQLK